MANQFFFIFLISALVLAQVHGDPALPYAIGQAAAATAELRM